MLTVISPALEQVTGVIYFVRNVGHNQNNPLVSHCEGCFSQPDHSEILHALNYNHMVHLFCLNEFRRALRILFTAMCVTKLIVFMPSDQLHISDAQVRVESENGDFSFTFPNPKNVSEFSMILFKGSEKEEICALHLSEEKVIPMSNVTYCQTQNSRNSTTFILKNLGRQHIDVYTYDLKIFLPPPYIDCCLKETNLYVQGKFSSLLPLLQFTDK